MKLAIGEYKQMKMYLLFPGSAAKLQGVLCPIMLANGEQPSLPCIRSWIRVPPNVYSCILIRLKKYIN
jgi:hypothetical protein